MLFRFVTNSYGIEVDFDVAASLMDDDIREELHAALAPCTEQLFFDEYAKAHLARFDEDWEMDTARPPY